MEREYLLQKQKLHILQHSERLKEKERSASIEKSAKEKTNGGVEIIEKITLRERGNSMHKSNSGLAGTIYKKH